MERVSGDSGAIASSTNSCGMPFRCLRPKGMSSIGKEALSRLGFVMEVRYQNSTSELGSDWLVTINLSIHNRTLQRDLKLERF